METFHPTDDERWVGFRNAEPEKSGYATETSYGGSTILGLGESDEKNIKPVVMPSKQVPQEAPADIAPEDPAAVLPGKRGSRAWRYLRWNFFSVYRKLFAVVLIANLAVLIAFVARKSKSSRTGLTIANTLDAVSINLLFAILMRQEHVVNLLFLLSSSLPTSAPLLLRRWVAKIYSYGGLHSGCAVAALVWYIGFAGVLTRDWVTKAGPYVPLSVVIITYLNVALFLLISGFAHPTMRNKMHNHFEAIHRFAGWMAVALFWAQLILLENATRQASLGLTLLRSPAFWSLVIITVCLFYPWFRLRRRTVRPEFLSKHAVRLHFDYTQLDYCMGVRLTTDPLTETHAFATIPEANNEKGFSILISNAGDWTNRMIEQQPTKIWVKGAPAYGVLRMAVIFKRFVVVTTGSGIGPCLSLLQARPDLVGRVRVLWSTPNPLQTYGQGVIDAVIRADPAAVIINTRTSGRPDMVALTYGLYKDSNAEAVVCISNPKVTRKVVYGMETRGIPAYGPIFDS